MNTLFIVGDGAASESAETSSEPKEMVDFKVIYNKVKHDVSFALDDTVANLKGHIQTLTGRVVIFFLCQKSISF